jgi:hypothetical protein
MGDRFRYARDLRYEEGKKGMSELVLEGLDEGDGKAHETVGWDCPAHWALYSAAVGGCRAAGTQVLSCGRKNGRKKSE